MKAKVALRLHLLSFTDLAALTAIVIKGFQNNVSDFPSPSPAILTVSGHLATYNQLISAWGGKGTRGSHETLIKLKATRNILRDDLRRLADYAQSVSSSEEILQKIGWALRRSTHQTIGVLNRAENLRQSAQTNVPTGAIKLMWDKPLDTVQVRIPGYHLFRATVADFSTAVQITSVTKTSYTDKSVIGSPGIYYYWVIPFNSHGQGAISDFLPSYSRPL